MIRKEDITELLSFAKKYAEVDPHRLLLSKNDIPNHLVKEVALQIELQKRFREKLPLWAEKGEIFIPSRLALEQASSLHTAAYKSRWSKGIKSVVDLTGGLGVDFAALMQEAECGAYFERDEHLALTASYNLPLVLGSSKSIRIQNDDYATHLQWIREQSFDLIYLDPARRSNSGARVYGFADCQPNLLDVAQELLPHCGSMLAKISPMMDLSAALRDFADTCLEAHIVAVKGEVKEILLHLSSKRTDRFIERVPITAANIIDAANIECFSFTLEDERLCPFLKAKELGNYIYDPNAALMKAAPYKLIALRYGIEQLHHNTHLYCSYQLLNNFPGRVFKLLEEPIDFSVQSLKELRKKVSKASLMLRNFPESVEALRKRLKIAEGGEHFLIACTLGSERKVLLLCKRVS